MKKRSIINEAEVVRTHDHEADMARSDLYKIAEYAVKLFKMIDSGDNLEGWTAAKITKASDYISSVYHYMEYERKFPGRDGEVDQEESVKYDESIKKELSSNLQEQWQKRKQG